MASKVNEITPGSGEARLVNGKRIEAGIAGNEEGEIIGAVVRIEN